MKKQIALIIISMLAVMPANAHNTKNNTMCQNQSNTPICEMGEGVIQPNLCEIFCTCPPADENMPDTDIPENNIPDIPENDTYPDIPVLPDEPIIPEQPETPDIPETPEEPSDSYVLEVFRLVNAEREKYGLSPLTYDSHLSRAATIRCEEIKTHFSHTRPDGTSCFTVLDEVGYSYRGAGENIAYGQKSPEEVMNAWMNSEGHRANILGSQYTNIGVGAVNIGGVMYWTQLFAY